MEVDHETAAKGEKKVDFDNEVLAYLTNRKNDLKMSHEDYINEHPEIREVLNDFMSSVLLHKPVSYLSVSHIWFNRTMYLFTLKSTSILSTQLHSEESHSF